MLRAATLILACAFVLAAGALWWITRPDPLPANAMAGLTGDVAHGRTLFWAGGCASCHAAKGASGEAQLHLGGGQKLASQFGTFTVPNISPDRTAGIGAWSLHDFADAMLRGLSPEGQHLYPAFPYAAYSHMRPQDVADLKAFLDTLPPVATRPGPHALGFPFNIRRFVGVWKVLFLHPGWVVTDPLTAQQAQGRYLVEALAHCGECHTPRNALGGLDYSRWMAGAPNPAGAGRIPGITPATLEWSSADLVSFLTTGLTPDYDSAGGEMADVISNMAKLPVTDVEAIAAYLKALPPRK